MADDVDDPHLRAPLAPFAGARLPAPDWYRDAMAKRPETASVPIDGYATELLTWGERGKPGLLLLHGNGAHAGWWRFIAPFLASDHRVAAFSWAGMGGSAHRPDYSVDGFVTQLLGAADAAGLFEAAAAPVVVGHSFGGFPMMAMAGQHGARFGGVVIVDTPFRAPGEPGGRPPNAGERTHRIYPTLTAALARFRLAPTQSCANLFIADDIARGSLVETIAPDGSPGWTWAFDPYLWSRFTIGDARTLLVAPQCPVALIWGERSALMPPATIATMRTQLPPGSPAFAIPDAAHHVMIDQPLAFVAALRGLLAGWPQPTGVAT